MLKSRIITAVILLLLLLLILFVLPDAWWAGVVVLLVVQGVLEWSRLSKMSGKNAYIYAGLTLVIMSALVWFDATHTSAERIIPHLLIYAVSALLWLFVVPTWMITGWKPQNQLWLGLVGWAVLIPTGLAMLDLHAINPQPWVLLLLMGLVWVADIGAYFAGRRFGRHKLAPSISPGKTWEGVAGGMAGASVYMLTIGYFSPFAALPLMLLAAWWWVGLAVIGDLFESAIKRQAGVKDSGALLPGHGGLLDRIDALTSTLPLAAMVILFGQLN
ncbi:MAG: phosphatidate cytidylyltransferase [Gallionella sp.]|nr:phosphatidate cytidylyltransferase [Gallionella sp.]